MFPWKEDLKSCLKDLCSAHSPGRKISRAWLEGQRTPPMEEDDFGDAGDKIQPSHLLSTIHPSSRKQADVSRAWTSTLGGQRPTLQLPAPVPSFRGAGRTAPGGDSLEMTPHPPESRRQLRRRQLSQEKLHASFSLPGKGRLSWPTGRQRMLNSCRGNICQGNICQG